MIGHRLLPLLLLVGLGPLSTLPAQSDDSQVTRYLRFRAGDRVAYGTLRGDTVHELGGDLYGKHWATDRTHPLASVEILVPSRPTKVFALAGNYRDHLGDTPVPAHPEPFIKLPSCLVPHGAKIIQPEGHEPVHFEV